MKRWKARAEGNKPRNQVATTKPTKVSPGWNKGSTVYRAKQFGRRGPNFDTIGPPKSARLDGICVRACGEREKCSRSA